MSNTVIYKVAPNRIAWSEKHQKHFYEGEKIDLSHASGQAIAAALASGVIVEEHAIQAKTIKTKKEVKSDD